MNEMLVLATLAARHVLALESELAILRNENAELKTKIGPQAVPGPATDRGADGAYTVS